MEGILFGLQRFSVHDGPGIRTTVFLKGCNLRCRWCHNPESFRIEPVLAWNEALCVGCRACEAVCERAVHRFEEGIHRINRAACTACGACVAACAAKALEVIGTRVEPDWLMKQLLKDARYYASSGGGVTFSGGEALLQRDFTWEMLHRCREAGLSVALETNGALPFAYYEPILDLVDWFLVDYKLTDEDKHRAYTGASREQILQTLAQLHARGARVVLRCPVIPGVNDDDGHFQAIAEWTRVYPNFAGAELLAYHNLGASKAARIGDAYTVYEQPTETTLEQWKQRVRDFGGRIFSGYGERDAQPREDV